MSSLARTAHDFDALPLGQIVLAVTVVDPRHTGLRSRVLWHKVGRGEWVRLDPVDRYDGEQTHESGYLESMLKGFGRRGAVPGVALVLGPGDSVFPDSIAELPKGSVIQVDGEQYPHTHLGLGQWEYADPADQYNGEYPAVASNIGSSDFRWGWVMCGAAW